MARKRMGERGTEAKGRKDSTTGDPQ